MPITTTIKRMSEIVPLQRMHRMGIFDDYLPNQPIALTELIENAGIMFTAKIIPSIKLRYNKNVQGFALDCLNIVNDLHYRGQYTDVPKAGPEVKFDNRHDLFMQGKSLLELFIDEQIDKTTLQDTAIAIEVQIPHDQHPEYHPLMAVGHALQENLHENLEDVCFHVLQVTSNPLGLKEYHRLMSGCMKERFG